MYKTKSVGVTETQPAPNNKNGIPENTTTAASLKYLSKFWRSLEIPLISCKVELELEWTRQCVLAAAGIDNISANDDNIIFTIKDKEL